MNSDKAYRKNAVRLFCGLILLGKIRIAFTNK